MYVVINSNYLHTTHFSLFRHIKILNIIQFRTRSGQYYAGATSGTIPTRRVLQYIHQQLIIVNVNYVIGGYFQLDGLTDLLDGGLTSDGGISPSDINYISGGDTVLTGVNYVLDGVIGLVVGDFELDGLIINFFQFFLLSHSYCTKSIVQQSL
ncbi:unnamed protein product [Rotaria sordida]|uniref:Uncharacterized protein n=1 Tax=Rotaria sordida TaxID=392033 RepID=A0A815Z988_9BILA|nr:unnamed protein product [Rotaria sordida]CAF1579571.1 unnamed protein product [Rotaria sordida]